MKKTLKNAIQRFPISLGGFFYTLQPGENVFIHSEIEGKIFVSTIENPSHRIGEDIFEVKYTDLE